MRIIVWMLLAVLALLPGRTCLGQGTGVDVELDTFGVGGAWRGGDITAIRLKLTSSLAESANVWVQWQVPNADGDIGEYGRMVPLTPGRATMTWLYAPIPPDTDQSLVWTVRVFEFTEAGERGAELGGTRISPPAGGVDPLRGMIAIVGSAGNYRLGLDGYMAQGGGTMLSANEETRIVPGLRVADLPDRWEGLRGFEALVWAGDNDAPSQLSLNQAQAVREYVRRGGHLVIVLPSSGNPWALGADEAQMHLLSDLLPTLAPKKQEQVPLSDLLPALHKSRDLRSLFRNRAVPQVEINIFKQLRAGPEGFTAIDNAYEPLLALPDGRVVAIQRTLGHGRISIIGIDLPDGRLAAAPPQADVLWNRVLGRRADTPTTAEVQELQNGGLIPRSPRSEFAFGVGPFITSRISMPSQANIGLLLAFVLFVAYWVVAGPGGFLALKHFKQVQHSWVAFAAATAVFTGIAWGAVSLSRKGQVGVQHVTFLDHVARPAGEASRPEDPQMQRASSYFALYLPKYGQTKVSIASDPDQRDLLTSWTPPNEPIQRFPNVDRYTVNVDANRASIDIPSRSTATNLYAHWMGGLSDSWGGVLSADPASPITVVKDASGREVGLSGRVLSDLPGPLRDATIIWVRNDRTSQRLYARRGTEEQPHVPYLRSGDVLNLAYAVGLTNTPSFDANTPLDLGKIVFSPSSMLDSSGSAKRGFIYSRYVQQNEDRGMQGMGVSDHSETTFRLYAEMLSLYHQLTPPSYFRTDPNARDENSVALMRMLGRELDLSAWFTRPCIIIIGYLDDSECPVPLRIEDDDEPPPSTGITVVRWVYPLPLDEAIAFEPPKPQDDEPALAEPPPAAPDEEP